VSVKACKPLRGIRPGVWRCTRHPSLPLRHSLAIAHHLGSWAISPENASDVVGIPRGMGCQATDVYFECRDHGEEAA